MIILLLWSVRGQTEGMEEENVDGTSVMNNRIYIQNKNAKEASRPEVL